MNEMVDFLRGGTLMAEVGIAVFFLRSWRETHDRLFIFFAAALFVMAISQVVIVYFDGTDSTPYAYWLRLAAFLLLILGIVEKNIPRKS